MNMIRNRHGVFIMIAVFSLGMVSAAQAGMINYDRRKGVVTKAPARKPAPATVAAKPQAPSAYTNNSAVVPIPSAGAFRVTNSVEKKFDANNDGMLQADEQKKFLRDVLAAAQAKGGYTVNSDLLKKYDVNGDGVITRYELAGLQTDSK